MRTAESQGWLVENSLVFVRLEADIQLAIVIEYRAFDDAGCLQHHAQRIEVTAFQSPSQNYPRQVQDAKRSVPPTGCQLPAPAPANADANRRVQFPIGV